MKLDLDKPVQTRDGRKARIICKDFKREGAPILAAIEIGSGEESTLCYPVNGKLLGSGETDLVNIPEEKELWVNVGKHGDVDLHKTRVSADKSAKTFKDRIARIKVPYKAGQFDE